jgi:acetylornithine deacetylase/succinyl-diaminopimelate desuccinylase-like protein
MTRTFIPFIIALVFGLASPAAAQTADSLVNSIITNAKFKEATAFLERDQDRFVRELITLTEIPAPPFKEKARAAAYLEWLRGLGLSEVEMDAEGNVMGIRWGTGHAPDSPMLAVLAHLDTVFPEGTDVKVKRDGTKLKAPGVGDDTRGLALILSLIRAMDAAKFQTAKNILFVGNVGEEGEGDLRGVKYLLQKGKYKDRIKAFISIDGGDQGPIVNGALGSKRYRVTFTGPGGHSYNAFGLVSPAFAMGSALAKFSRVVVPAKPKTTFNVGVIGGGTSVNSIPTEMFMDVDMRSESPVELNKLVTTFLVIIREAVDEENRTRSTAEGKIGADVKLIGDRPSGETAISSSLVQSTTAAVKAFGLAPTYGIGSTDSNIPISLGIPAVTIGRGNSARSHALDEWVDVEKQSSVQAAQVALTIILTAAQ